MSLADFMLPQISPDSPRLAELVDATPPSALFAGYDAQHQELLLGGSLRVGIEELGTETLATAYKPLRNEQFIDSLPSAPKKCILWDMEDARAFDSRVYTGRDLNVFQYNRRVGNRHAVLWRLRNYFEPSRAIGHAGRVEDTMDFADKKDLVYWRGSIAGSRWIDPFTRVGALTANNASEFVASADHFSRITGALLSKSSPNFDIKLAGPAYVLESRPWLADLGVLDETVAPAQQLQNKYILCLNGNDVASNLYWVLSSQSVAMKEECSYEVLPDYFLKPWVHYVPIASGLTDLQEKFDYCQANPALCLSIIENANEAYHQIVNTTVWKEAELEVFDRLGLG